MKAIVIRKLDEVPSDVDLRYVLYNDGERAIWNEESLTKDDIKALADVCNTILEGF